MGKIERDKGMSQLDYLWTYYGGYIIKKEDDQDNPQYFLLTENQIDDKIKNNTQSIFQNLPIKEVSSSYFIKNDNGTIKSSISLVYKSNLIQLIGLDNQVISTIDASSFIKDGMVNNVQLITNPQGQAEGTYIVITFNTDSGLEPIYLNVTQLIDIYVGGNGISIQNNQVSIKLDTSSEEYLSISENGIKISGIKQIQETLPQVYNSLQDIELSSKFNTNKLYIDSSKSQIYIYKDNNLVLLKGLKGDPLTFDDLTEEQIAELQKPATEAISLATQAAQNAQTSAQNADNATQKATQAISNIQSVQTQFQQKEQEWQTAEATRQDNETKRVAAENVRVTEFSQIQSTANSLIEETTTTKNNAVEATTNANKAAENADTATEKANTAAASANEAATAANNAAQKVDGRVTALEGKASQSYANLSEIQNSGDKNANKIYIDKETNTSYRYDSSSDSYVNIGATLKNEEVAEMCFRELFINVGGKYENGKYSYFGIDLTYDEAKTAYNYPIISYRELSNYNYPARRDGYAFSCKVLISKLPAFGAGWTQSRSFEGIRSENLILHNVDEIININNTAFRTFNSEYIKNIYNILDFRNRTSDIDKYFWGSLLEDVKIKNIKVNLDISLCVKLYYKSIKYIVDNASNTSAITITVHPTTYGYLTGTIQPTQVGGTTEEWQAIVTTATEKQITFATTE